MNVVMPEVTMRVEAVRVIGRHRKDLGDVKALADDIEKNGLINPITVTADCRLLAGQRRLEAFRLLGRNEIQAHVVDTLDDAALALRIERSENTQRLAMKPSELVSLGSELEALERPKARERQASKDGSRSPAHVGRTSSEDRRSPAGNVGDIVGQALGMSRNSYDRAKTVVREANNPNVTKEERRIAQEALADMDATGNIGGNYERVRKGITTRTGTIPRPVMESAAAQRRAISSAEAALSGICHGLGQIEALHEEIAAEEAARWMGSLFDSRSVITQLIKLLKERTNGDS